MTLPHVIEGGRIELHLLPSQRFLHDLFALAQTPEVSRYLEWEPHQTLADTEDFFEICRTEREQGTGYHFGVMEDGIVKGVVGLFAFDGFRQKAEIGSWLGQEHWGKGLRNRAQALLQEYAFVHLGLEKVYFRVAKQNERAIRALGRSAAVLEGTLRREIKTRDGLMDALYYGILREEYLASADRVAIRVT